MLFGFFLTYANEQIYNRVETTLLTPNGDQWELTPEGNPNLFYYTIPPNV